MVCPSCATENPQGKKFCIECGTSLARACASCGAALVGNEKFCGECGAPTPNQAGSGAGAPPARETPLAERRLVSVLFADLVGFTTLSESRDSEEVRELLSRYFDTCSRLIGLYGGSVEKFIGDAVMAVWGTPTATEDDAERAVRAALDLVAAVSALGDRGLAGRWRSRPRCNPGSGRRATLAAELLVAHEGGTARGARERERRTALDAELLPLRILGGAARADHERSAYPSGSHLPRGPEPGRQAEACRHSPTRP